MAPKAAFRRPPGATHNKIGVGSVITASARKRLTRPTHSVQYCQGSRHLFQAKPTGRLAELASFAPRLRADVQSITTKPNTTKSDTTNLDSSFAADAKDLALRSSVATRKPVSRRL